jgi:hypothetical protein
MLYFIEKRIEKTFEVNINDELKREIVIKLKRSDSINKLANSNSDPLDTPAGTKYKISRRDYFSFMSLTV